MGSSAEDLYLRVLTEALGARSRSKTLRKVLQARPVARSERQSPGQGVQMNGRSIFLTPKRYRADQAHYQAVATDGEQRQAEFALLAARFPEEALAQHLIDKFDLHEGEIRAIRKLHALNLEDLR